MAQYSEEWFYPTGQLATNQRAIVFGPGDDNVVAPIFSDPGMTIPLANPTVTDANGVLTFYAADGTYWIWVGPTTGGNGVETTLGASPDDPVLSVDGVGPDAGGDVPLGALVESLADAKGDILAATGPDAFVRVPVGLDTFVLTADSSDPAGVSWQASGGGGGGIPVSIIDAKGDLIAGQAADAPVRVGVGTDGQVLRADSGATPGVAWDTLTASDVGAVPTSRVLTAGIAMSGGGDLSADRTFDVDLGTTAGTAAAGNDTRIVNAIQGTIIDAKGDIITATAADTPVRKAVGTDGQVLRANSAISDGLEWDTLTASDVGAVPVTLTPDIVYGTTTAGAPLNREVSTIASPDTIAWRTAENQLRADTVADANPAADADDLINRGYFQTASGLFVPTSRTITTQNGLTGGGDLSANRTIEPVYGTGANQVAQGNDTRIVNALQQTILDAKGDIIAASAADTPVRVAVGTDNQVLRANSGATPGVDWHTLTASDVGAIATTIMDAKGDLISASAADTPVIVGVGANGTVLTADSAQSAGIKWAAPAASYLPFAVAPRASEYYQASGVITVRSSKAPTLNVMYLYPCPVQFATTLTGVAWENTAAVATAVVRLGIYSPSAANGVGSLLVDFGTFTNDTATVIAATVSQAIPAGLMWLAWVPQTIVASARHGAGWNPYVGSTSFPNGTGTGWNNCYFQTGVSGTLPGTVTIGGATDAPVVGVKYA